MAAASIHPAGPINKLTVDICDFSLSFVKNATKFIG